MQMKRAENMHLHSCNVNFSFTKIQLYIITSLLYSKQKGHCILLKKCPNNPFVDLLYLM